MREIEGERLREGGRTRRREGREGCKKGEREAGKTKKLYPKVNVFVLY